MKDVREILVKRLKETNARLDQTLSLHNVGLLPSELGKKQLASLTLVGLHIQKSAKAY